MWMGTIANGIVCRVDDDARQFGRNVIDGVIEKVRATRTTTTKTNDRRR